MVIKTGEQYMWPASDMRSSLRPDMKSGSWADWGPKCGAWPSPTLLAGRLLRHCSPQHLLRVPARLSSSNPSLCLMFIISEHGTPFHMHIPPSVCKKCLLTRNTNQPFSWCRAASFGWKWCWTRSRNWATFCSPGYRFLRWNAKPRRWRWRLISIYAMLVKLLRNMP